MLRIGFDPQVAETAASQARKDRNRVRIRANDRSSGNDRAGRGANRAYRFRDGRRIVRAHRLHRPMPLD